MGSAHPFLNHDGEFDVDALGRRQVVKYMCVASLALLTLDWILLIGDEVELIWKKRWSLMKILYIVCRYIAFVDISLGVIYNTAPGMTPELCETYYRILTWIMGAGMTTSEYILIWRTYAIWNKSRTVLLSLSLSWSVLASVNIYFVYAWNVSWVYDRSQTPAITGCHMVKGRRTIAGAYCVLALLEIAMVILTGIKGICQFRNAIHPLIRTLYRDGFFVFFCILMLSLVNVINIVRAPVDMLDLWSFFAHAVHSVLYCRVLLHLRIIAHRQANDTHLSDFSTLQFRSQLSVIEESRCAENDTIEMSTLSNSRPVETTGV